MDAPKRGRGRAATYCASEEDLNFDKFLAEQGIDIRTASVKEAFIEQLADAMEQQGLTKLQMASRMKVSPFQIDKIFNPKFPSSTLDTLRRAANAVGRSLRIDLV